MSVRVQSEDFSVDAEIANLVRGRLDVGAVVSFTGLVRGEAGGQPLKSMTLEHYPGMTEAELARIEREAHTRFDVTQTLIIHRFGDLTPGEQIVLVIAASRHRQQAFEAASFLMDFLKTRAPFWKKETRLDGTEVWVDARASDMDADAGWG